LTGNGGLMSIEIDHDEVAALIAKLDHDDKPTVRHAVDALVHLAADSPEICEMLDRRLAEPGHKQYWPVAYILGNLPQPSPGVITALLDALDHREADIRWAVSLLLARIATHHAGLIDSLIQLCATGSNAQKRMALYCLRDLALSDRASLHAMLSSLGDREATVRVAAAICLKVRQDIDDSGKDLVLQAYLNDTEAKVRHTAAIALAHLGDASEEFVRALEQNNESGDEQTRKAARAALERLEKRRSAPPGSASGR
jgi:HEAT repeat protein